MIMKKHLSHGSSSALNLIIHLHKSSTNNNNKAQSNKPPIIETFLQYVLNTHVKNKGITFCKANTCIFTAFLQEQESAYHIITDIYI